MTTVRWFLLFWIVLSLRPAFCQEFTTVIVGPAKALPAGAPVSAWVHFLNPSNQVVSRTFPARLAGRLTADPRSWDCVLELRGVGDPATVAIPPNGFARREYTVAAPAALEGRAWLTIPELAASPAALDFAKAPIAPPAPPSASPAAEGLSPGKPGFDPGRFFKEHIFGHEPLYFIAGPDAPMAKFQVSFKYRLFEPEGKLARKLRPLGDLYMGYTQTSLWDWSKPSAPFLDSSYMPELLYYHPRLARAGAEEWFQLDLQSGLKHESNGRDGAASRSLNQFYVKPTLRFGAAEHIQFSLAPRAWFYLGDLDDNPDLPAYRGHLDLRATLGWANSVQLTSLVRAGDEFNRGSLQLDLTYPLWRLPGGLTWFLHAQYFTGYGESLLLYHQRSQAFRAGFSLYR